MKYAAFILAAVAVMLVVSPAYGQVVGGGKKGAFANHQPFAKTPEEAFKEAKERQCPMVLCIPSRGWGGVIAEPGEFCKANVKKVAQYFVIMVAHPAYPAVARWGSQYGLPDGSAPRDNSIYVFFDSNGNELAKYRKNDGCSAKFLTSTMAAVLKEKGKGVSFSDYRKLLPDFNKAQKLLEVGYYAEAYRMFEKLSKKKFKPSPPMVETSKKRLGEITEKTSQLLKEIGQKVENGEKAQALVAYQVLRARCRGLKIATEITKKISSLEKDGAITADDKKKAKMEAKGCEVYLKAESFAADGNKKSAKMYFDRVVKSYKETSFCEKAKERAEELE